MGFIDRMKRHGFAVESVCTGLREQGVQVATRTYRSWAVAPPAARTVSDAAVVDAIRSLRVDAQGRATPESLYGRRKTTAMLRRRGLVVAHCTVDRLMREHGWNELRRGRAHRTTIRAKDVGGPGTCSTATSARRRRIGLGGRLHLRPDLGRVRLRSVRRRRVRPAHRRHAMSTRPPDLVLVSLRMACWVRDQQQHPIVAGQLTAHSDAGSQCVSVRYTEHLALHCIAASIGTVGDAYDNCLMESINGLFKN